MSTLLVLLEPRRMDRQSPVIWVLWDFVEVSGREGGGRLEQGQWLGPLVAPGR